MMYGPLAALPTAGLIPAAFQAIIAKEPCIAWLPLLLGLRGAETNAPR